MAYKTVLFDLDGTITNPKAGITKAVQYSLRKFGMNIENPDDLVSFIGPPLRPMFMSFGGLSEDQAEEAVKYYREYYTDRGIFDATLYDGVADLLKSLKKSGKSVVLATSKPQVYAEKILEHFMVAESVDFVAGSELNKSRNEKWEVIDYAVKTLNIKPEETIMVGDRLHDIDGAHKNGIKCIAVLYGYGSPEEFAEHNADYVVGTVDELKKLLTEI